MISLILITLYIYTFVDFHGWIANVNFDCQRNKNTFKYSFSRLMRDMYKNCCKNIEMVFRLFIGGKITTNRSQFSDIQIILIK